MAYKHALYATTYWTHKGKHEALANKLHKLIPSEGEVKNADKNPALERFRVASNCYYDLYNNGLCNLADEFSEVFGLHVEPGDAELTKALVNHTERKMDGIVLAAAKEQGLSRTGA